MTEARLTQAEGGWPPRAAQEGFLVLDGEALLIIDGEEHPLKRWDYVHCPPGVPHVLIGAGDGALVLAVGARATYAKFGELEASAYPGSLLPE
jgi:quercetin dioxygenase-like cupin family protein